MRQLLSIDFDTYKILVEQLCKMFIFKTLMRHHMTPVTCGVADGEKDKLVLFFCPKKCFFTPRMPINGVLFMLQKIG